MKKLSWLIGVLAALALLFAFTGCDDDPKNGDTRVNIAAIPGVTAPATGGTAVLTTETDQYTGAVSWAPALVDGKFAASQIYTATITLTAKSGFTFSGVAANFFTVAGATATNSADSGVVTAVFGTTAGTDDNPVRVDIAAIPGVTAPATGETPVTTITETAQYIGAVSWAPDLEDGKFAAGETYTATITLTAKSGFTFTGVAANFFTVADATTTNDAGSNRVTAVFSATDLGDVKPSNTLFTFTLEDNFQWSTGYQGLMQNADLFSGGKVEIGDVYSLKFSFVAERDFIDELFVGLVDPVERGTWPDATYWHPLTWVEEEDPELVPGAAADNIIKRGEVVTAEITLIALAASASNAPAANSLMFQTGDEDGNSGTAGSGVRGPIDLYFTEFEFEKVGTSEWSLADYLEANFPSGSGIFTSSSNRPLRFSSSQLNPGNTRGGAPEGVDNVVDGGINVIKSRGTGVDTWHGFNLFVHGVGSGALNLDIANNIYEIIVAGSVIGTPPSNARMIISNDQGNLFTFSSDVLEGENATFKVSGELPAEFVLTNEAILDANNTQGNLCIRIRANNEGVAMDHRVTEILIIDKGPR